MQLFMVIGGIFIIIGVIKFFIQKEPKVKPLRDEENFARQVSGVGYIDKKEEKIFKNMPKGSQTPKNIPTIIYCKNCRAKNYNTSHFCHICGARLK